MLFVSDQHYLRITNLLYRVLRANLFVLFVLDILVDLLDREDRVNQADQHLLSFLRRQAVLANHLPPLHQDDREHLVRQVVLVGHLFLK